METESALVVLIPEAEELVSSFRIRYDPSASWGVPAHVTVLYPFKPPAEIDTKDIAGLETVFRSFAPFTASFSRKIVDHEMLYLPPEPKSVFVAMTQAVTRSFPDYPPYKGIFKEILPHLTVALPDDPAELARIDTDFRDASNGKFPFTAEIAAVTLMDSRNGKWEAHEKFPLAGSE